MLEQWVNLPKDDQFAKDGITKERCGRITLEAMFEKDNIPIQFKVKVSPIGNKNAKYNRKRRHKNLNFKIRKKTAGLADKKHVLLEESIYLPAAGGNKYKIEAKDAHGNEVKAAMEVETRRKLYYQVISMKGVPYPASLDSFEEAFRNESDKFYIVLEEKDDGRNKMTLKELETVQDSNDALFRDEARKVYSISKYEPYATAVVFSNYIADKKWQPYQDQVNRVIPNKLFKWGDYEVDITLTDSNGDLVYLWDNLDPADDANKGWLVKGSALFLTVDGDIKIPDDDISLTGPKKGAEGGYHQLKVRFSAPSLRKFFRKLKGQIYLEVNIVDGFSGGFSYNSMNLITVATKAWWDSNNETEMLQILNHEMGHKIGMVADGKGRAPNKPPTLYGDNRGVNDKGHQGSHCEKGCNYNDATQEWSGVPGCVMFGATGLYDANTKTYTASPDTFCGDCGKVVRKLDLDGTNLPGLKNRF